MLRPSDGPCAVSAWSGKQPFLFTQSQSIHARSWVPCMDSPGVRLTYEAVVRVPVGATAVMAAEAGAHEPEKGVFRFRMPQPIPPYLVSSGTADPGVPTPSQNVSLSWSRSIPRAMA